MLNVFKGDRQRIYWHDQYALNTHELAFAQYDPDRIAQELIDTGADIIAVYAGNQFSVAYYPSAVWPQHPALDGRDYFGDLCTRLQARGKKVIAYINWLESRHPEWNRVPLGGQGKPEAFPLAQWADISDPEKQVRDIPGGKWQFACRISPRCEQVLAIAKEIVTRYRPDGFHLDMFHGDAEICLCDCCRPAVESLCGTTDITLEVIQAHWPAYIDWRCARTASLIRDLSDYLHGEGVFCAHNGAWPMGLSVLYGFSDEWLPHLDVYVSEIFTDIHSAAMTVRWHHAVGKPSCELQTSTPPGFAHLSISGAWWELAAATCKANGCHVFGPCGVGAFPDTTTSPELLAHVTDGFATFMEDEDLHTGARSAAPVALVFSWATRKYFRAGALDWSNAISGWSHLLIEEHLPFDFVIAEHVTTAEDLSRYQLVILPDTACVGDAFCDAIRGYAGTGGKVIATGETSLYDSRGGKRADFALADLFGCSWRKTLDGPFAFGPGDEPRPAVGPFQCVESRGEVLFQRHEPDHAGPVSGQNDPMPVGPGQWPAATRQTTGDGETVYVAWEPAANYQHWRVPHFAAFMAGLLRRMVSIRPFECDAPRSVEVTLWEQPEAHRTILHLANRTQDPENLEGVNEIVPLPPMEFRLRVPSPEIQITARHAGVVCEVRDGTAIAHVTGMRAYAALVIEDTVK